MAGFNISSFVYAENCVGSEGQLKYSAENRTNRMQEAMTYADNSCFGNGDNKLDTAEVKVFVAKAMEYGFEFQEIAAVTSQLDIASADDKNVKIIAKMNTLSSLEKQLEKNIEHFKEINPKKSILTLSSQAGLVTGGVIMGAGIVSKATTVGAGVGSFAGPAGALVGGGIGAIVGLVTLGALAYAGYKGGEYIGESFESNETKEARMNAELYKRENIDALKAEIEFEKEALQKMLNF